MLATIKLEQSETFIPQDKENIYCEEDMQTGCKPLVDLVVKSRHRYDRNATIFQLDCIAAAAAGAIDDDTNDDSSSTCAGLSACKDVSVSVCAAGIGGITAASSSSSVGIDFKKSPSWPHTFLKTASASLTYS
jgi:hypothetical protein